jgi:ABC-type Fe3+ transport system substrate-binding protein
MQNKIFRGLRKLLFLAGLVLASAAMARGAAPTATTPTPAATSAPTRKPWNAKWEAVLKAARQRGAWWSPVQYFVPEGYGSASVGGGVVARVKGGSHANAATVYLNWFLGREAQERINKIIVQPRAEWMSLPITWTPPRSRSPAART